MKKVRRKAGDQWRASYAAALILWRGTWHSQPGRKPIAAHFGLSEEEAEEIEREGYPLDGLPEHLRPRERPEC